MSENYQNGANYSQSILNHQNAIKRMGDTDSYG